MKMTKNRLQILKMMSLYHSNRKAFHNYKGTSVHEFAKFMKSKGIVLSHTSVSAYLQDLSLLDYVKHDEGTSGTWMISKEGEEYLKDLTGAIE